MRRANGEDAVYRLEERTHWEDHPEVKGWRSIRAYWADFAERQTRRHVSLRERMQANREFYVSWDFWDWLSAALGRYWQRFSTDEKFAHTVLGFAGTEADGNFYVRHRVREKELRERERRYFGGYFDCKDTGVRGPALMRKEARLHAAEDQPYIECGYQPKETTDCVKFMTSSFTNRIKTVDWAERGLDDVHANPAY